MREFSDHLRKERSIVKYELREIEAEKIILDEVLHDTDVSEKIAISIKLEGIKIPIVVEQLGEEYKLISGAQRVLACRRFRIALIPALVYQTDLSEAERAVIQLLENFQRHRPNPIQEATVYRRYIAATLGIDSVQDIIGKLIQYRLKDIRCTKADVSSIDTLLALTGKKSSKTIESCIRLLRLPSHIMEAIRRKEIGTSIGYLLAENCEHPELELFFQSVRSGRLSRAKLLTLIKDNKSFDQCKAALCKMNHMFELRINDLTPAEAATLLPDIKKIFDELEYRALNAAPEDIEKRVNES